MKYKKGLNIIPLKLFRLVKFL